MIRDPPQHIDEVRVRVDALQFAAPDQRVEIPGRLSTAVGLRKQPVLPSDHRLPQHQLRHIVVHRKLWIFQMQAQRLALIKRLADGHAERRFWSGDGRDRL